MTPCLALSLAKIILLNGYDLNAWPLITKKHGNYLFVVLTPIANYIWRWLYGSLLLNYSNWISLLTLWPILFTKMRARMHKHVYSSKGADVLYFKNWAGFSVSHIFVVFMLSVITRNKIFLIFFDSGTSLSHSIPIPLRIF